MKKALKWILILIGILFLFLLAAPFLFKDKIINAVKSEANKNLNAEFSFSSLDLSLIRNFPNLSVTLNDLAILNRAPFQGDTLIFAKEASLTVNLMSVISGDRIDISKAFIDQAVMKFLVNKDGKANWDITKPTPPGAPAEEPSAFKVGLDRYEVKDSRILYDDRTLDFRLQLDELVHSGSGDFTQDLFVLSTQTAVSQLTLNYGGVDYLKKVKLTAQADLDMDMKNMKFTFKDNKLDVNDLPIAFSGWLAMPAEDIDMDLKFSTQKSEFKSLLSLIPAIYASSFDELTANGKISFDGFAKGRYNDKQLPGFGLTVAVENGSFKYPSLPSDVKNVNMDLRITNPDGVTDHTVVNLSKFHLEMAGDPFDARLLLKTPVSDPDIDAYARGKIDLSNVTRFMPLEKGTTLSGIILSDITLKGQLSSVENQQYDKFQAAGNLMVTALKYSSPAMKQPLNIQKMAMAFNPRQVTLDAFDAQIGKSDMHARGTLDNFLAYAMKGDVLKGSLNFNSSLLDLNEFMTGETTATASDTAALQVIDVPANIHFTLGAAVDRVVYQNLDIRNAKGTLVVKDKAIRMQDVIMQMLGGSLKMNGSYNTVDIKKPAVDFDLGITQFNIKQTATAMITVEKLAPVAKFTDGSFSSQLNFTSVLDAKMQPVLETTAGSGTLTTQAVTLTNFAPVAKLAEALKINSLKQLNVPNTYISFTIKGGRVFVEPFDVSLNGMKATVAGSNGLDQTIDYGINLNVPTALFGGAATNVLNSMVSKANTAGTNFSVGDQIPVEVGMKGTVTDPKISLNISKTGASMMSNLKQQAVDAAKTLVKEESDKLKKEAEAKLKAEQDKAKAEADKMKKEAEAKAKAYQDSLKKAAEKKAKDELNKFNPFKK